MTYEEAWKNQKEFMKASMHWMDAVIKTASDKEKLEANAKKQVLKLMVERMEELEEIDIK